jgi:glycosyltransferase involved in cell wall biosynthesis
MVLAGQVYAYKAHEEYFSKEIRPRLDRRRRFIGPVGFSAKRRLLAGARCLLVPSLVEETSCLVAMEALAAGTPVVAFRTGALPEIVEHGRTGYIVSDAEEMAEAIRMAGKLDAEECRQAAQTRFSAEAMVQRYLETYDRLIAQSRDAAAIDRGEPSWLFSWNSPSRGVRAIRATA